MQTEYQALLQQYLGYRSISTDPAFQDQIDATVNWLLDYLKAAGFSTQTFTHPEINPVVFGSYQVSPTAKTVLIYGHYDVQPADIKDGWDSPPFELTERSGRLYGRGVVDNKGQNLIHLFTIASLIQQHQLQYNVKFLLEGNEETANVQLGDLISAHHDLLQSDYVLISDGEILDSTPTIESSLRGGFNLTIVYKTAHTSLHSGSYGGAVPNAAYELAKLVADMADEHRSPAIPGFFEGVDPVTEQQLDSHAQLKQFVPQLLNQAGVKQQLSRPGTDFFTQIGLQPTIQVTGFRSGYVDQGYANIVPAEAEVRLNVRLAPSQDPERMSELIKKYVIKHTPSYVDWSISFHGLHHPVKVSTDSPIVQHAYQLLKSIYGQTPVYKPVGGAIPVVSDFKQILGAEILLIPFGNDDCNMHGANENFNLNHLTKGLEFSRQFFSQAA